MTISRFSYAFLALTLTGCGFSRTEPRNELESLLYGDVEAVIASVEEYMADHQDRPEKLREDLLKAGFTMSTSTKHAAKAGGRILTDCEAYVYRRDGDWISGLPASATVYFCPEESGATFGYHGL